MPLPIAFRGNLFFVGEHCLGATQVQSDGAASFGLLNHSRDDIALVLLELLVKKVPFGFPEALQHHLLGGLCRNSAGVVGQRLFGRNLVPDVGTLLNALGLRHGNLFIGVLDRFHHGLQRKNIHIPSVGVECYRDVLA